MDLNRPDADSCPGDSYGIRNKLLSLSVFKFSIRNKIHIFQFMRYLGGISKGTYEILHKISYPHIEKCDFQTLKYMIFYTMLKF